MPDGKGKTAQDVYGDFSVAHRFRASDLAHAVFDTDHVRVFDTDMAQRLINLVPAQTVRHFDSRIDWRKNDTEDKGTTSGIAAGFGMVTVKDNTAHTDGTKRYGLETLPWVRAGDFSMLNVATKREGRLYVKPFFRDKNDPLNIGRYRMLEYDPQDGAPLGSYAGDLCWEKSARGISFRHDYRLIAVPDAAPESFFHESMKRDIEKSVKIAMSVYFALITSTCAATGYHAIQSHRENPETRPAPAAQHKTPPAPTP